VLRVHAHTVRMAFELGEVVERIGPAQLARVDQTHEHVANVGAVVRLVEQGIPPMANRLLQRLEHGVVFLIEFLLGTV
jgi:hypothetical protein